MCGICGIIGKEPNKQSLVVQMCNILKHRGPETSGFFQHENVCLGHRRLSIIDLETGDQPIYNEDKSIVVVFNGEIYNFQTFKDELIQKGHTFYTSSDTEIIVHCYEEYGLTFLKDLNGIFAFALYDLKQHKLILVRDHFGIKPLHYWSKNNSLVFASEQKAILLYDKVQREVNYNALHSQINLRFTQGEETLFKDIYRLLPGHYLSFADNKIEIRQYYQLQAKPDFNLKRDEVLERGLHYIKQAIQRQLLSDVPIGVYLSGGMDSSAIVAMMHELNVSPINTFTMGFNEASDEFPDADQIANQFSTNHQTTSLSFEPLAQFPQVIWHAEEPKINLLQGYNMSKFVSPEYKVILGGLGGDELFIGYDIYKFLNAVRLLLKLTPHGFQKIALEPLSQFLFLVQNKSKTLNLDEYRRGLQMLLSIGDLDKFYLIMRNCWDFDKHFYKEIYHPSFNTNTISPMSEYFTPLFNKVGHLPALDAVAYTEFHSKMVNDYLLVDDRMSMAHSVELRVPFLDKDLVEFMFQVPVGMKMKGNTTKSLFREMMEPFLPQRIINKKKWGFTVNPYELFKKDLKVTAEKILDKKFVNDQGIFNYTYLRRIMDYPPTPRLRWHYNFLWLVLGIAIWDKMYIRSNFFKEEKFNLEDYYS
jgi:asparagine synthase (glutamine-hydrolysing)